MSVGPGVALFQVVRFWSRRWVAGAATASGASAHARDVLVLEAVEAAGDDASVAAVAHHAGIDRSGASRLIAGAAGRGYIVRGTAGRDARQAEVALTAQGRELLQAARAWQDEAFRALTAQWDPADAEQFAGHLRRLASQLEAGGPQDGSRHQRSSRRG